MSSCDARKSNVTIIRKLITFTVWSQA